jgi:HKD family nuclease
MNIVFTDNTTSKLIELLNPAFARAKVARFAVAFLRSSGLSLLKENLNRCLANGGEVEFLVGLDFRMTEPEALRTLHGLSSQGFKAKCYCFSDPSTGDTPVYHPKLYLLINELQAFITVGSSNLTQGGLRDNVEVNVVVTADLQEEIVSDVYALYNRLKFQQNRFEPTLEYIEKYEDAYERVQKRTTEALREQGTKQVIKELQEIETALPKPIPTGLELFGWQKLVYDRLPSGAFRTRDMYDYEHQFQEHYPDNRHIREKVRQVLQQLRDIGLLRNPRRDSWVKI